MESPFLNILAYLLSTSKFSVQLMCLRLDRLSKLIKNLRDTSDPTIYCMILPGTRVKKYRL